MKSLEIIDDIIANLEDRVEFQKDFLKANPKEKPNPIFERQLNGCKQIKQDLEVLEIIRKKDVNLATLKLCIMRTDTIEQLLSKYNKSRYFTQDELTMEELLKLKQWLEGNEDDNKSL